MFKHVRHVCTWRHMSPRKRTTPDSLRQFASQSEPFPVDVEDHGEEFLVSADLPGLRKQNLDISVRKDKLRIVADFGDDADGTYHRKERGRGEVRRVIRLPERIDEKRVAASYDEDGILRITLRKRHRPKRVEIE